MSWSLGEEWPHSSPCCAEVAFHHVGGSIGILGAFGLLAPSLALAPAVSPTSVHKGTGGLTRTCSGFQDSPKARGTSESSGVILWFPYRTSVFLGHGHNQLWKLQRDGKYQLRQTLEPWSVQILKTLSKPKGHQS